MSAAKLTDCLIESIIIIILIPLLRGVGVTASLGGYL